MGEFVSLTGTIMTCGWVSSRFGKGFFEAAIHDDTGVVLCRWFGAHYLRDQLHKGDRLFVYGKTRAHERSARFAAPRIRKP